MPLGTQPEDTGNSMEFDEVNETIQDSPLQVSGQEKYESTPTLIQKQPEIFT